MAPELLNDIPSVGLLPKPDGFGTVKLASLSAAVNKLDLETVSLSLTGLNGVTRNRWVSLSY
jgi:hypothetical protein